MANSRRRLKVTPARVRYWLRYVKSTGVFTWRVSPNRKFPAGSIAGTVNGNGYVQIMIEGKIYQAHRLAFLYVEGRVTHSVDHEDGDRQNNRWKNLRPSNDTHNQENRRQVRRDSSTGYMGVQEVKPGKFVAKISVAKKQIYLGSWDDPKLAHMAYLKAKRRLHAGNTL